MSKVTSDVLSTKNVFDYQGYRLTVTFDRDDLLASLPVKVSCGGFCIAGGTYNPFYNRASLDASGRGYDPRFKTVLTKLLNAARRYYNDYSDASGNVPAYRTYKLAVYYDQPSYQLPSGPADRVKVSHHYKRVL